MAPAPSVEGNSSIIATYNIGDETRTSLSGATDKSYVWDEADALGVFADKVGDKSNATFKFIKMVDQYTAEFKGSYEFIDTEEYIVYYPYNQVGYNTGEKSTMEELSVLEGKKVRLSIPATQLFNFDAKKTQSGERAGSFSQNTAPSIGKGSVENGNLTVKMKGAATYIFFPIKGTGSIKTLELSISGVDHLNGYNQVLTDINDPDFGFKAPSKNGTSTITLNCGVKGVKLDPETATNFWFVVPNLELKNATITAIVNGNDELKIERKGYTSATATGAWYPNTVYRIFDVDAEGKANTPWYIDVPAEDEDDFIIDNEYKFLEYAYAATVGENIPEIMKDGENLKAAKIVTNLDFSDFTFAAEGSDFRKAVAAWYNKAEGVIPTIGGAKAFTIKGSNADVAAVVEVETETPAAITITGLKVKGALFDDGSKNKVTNTIEDIILTDIKVTNSEFILANRVYSTGGVVKLKNVTVNTCDVLEGAALIGRAFTDYLGELTITNNAGYTFTRELNIMSDYDLTTELPEHVTYNSVVVNGTSSSKSPNGKKIIVKDKDDVKKFLDQVVTTDKSAKWYSVIDKDDISYYTGTPAITLRNNDGIITAEEFAYYIKNGGKYELTNSIDMMGEAVLAEAENATVTVKEGADVTISNVVVESAYLLAETGSANGVNVKGATYINSTAKYVGGLFGEAKVDDAAKTKNCSVEANHEAVTGKFGAHYGKVVVELKSGNSEITLNGVESSYGALVCQAAAGEIFTGEDGNTNVILTDPNVNLEVFASLIDWNWTENFPTKYKLTLKKKVDGSYKEVFFEFKVNNDAALQYKLENAETGETVKVEPGTYTTLPKPSAEEVIIDATGATFTEVLGKEKNIDLNGGKLIGATFTTKEYLYNTNANGTISGEFEECTFIAEGDKAYSGIYAYHTEADKPVTFTKCVFTANTTVAQVYADGAPVTYTDCTFNGYVSIAGTKGTTVKDCHFKVNETSKFAGVNVWAKTSFNGCKFYFQEYDAVKEKELGISNYFQWIAPVKQNNADDTIEFADCQVYDENNEFTRMTAEFNFRVSAAQDGVIVKVNNRDVTLRTNVL